VEKNQQEGEIMATKFFSFDELREAADCVSLAKTLGLEVKGDRCAAVWRGGDNVSCVSLAKTGWHDHKTGQSGDAVRLVEYVRKLERQDAQEWLGQLLNLEPRKSLKHEVVGQAERLKEDGYSLVKQYDYTDAKGKIVHCVQRWEHKTKPKEFVQCRPGGKPGIKGVETQLYNLPKVLTAKAVGLCEGEKDAETCSSLGLVGTTNASGCGTWEDRYSEALAGKRVYIFADNDEGGRSRAARLAWKLKDVAATVRIVSFDGEPEKFDLTDYLEKYGIEKTKKKIKISAEVDYSELRDPGEEPPAVIAAKEANQTRYQNFIEEVVEVDEGKKKTVSKPRHISEMVAELRTRLLGYPHRVGDRMFDLDKDQQIIRWIDTPNQLAMWLETKTKKKVMLKPGVGFIGKVDLYAAVGDSCRYYSAVSSAPHFPERSDVYYYGDAVGLPQPSTNYEAFEKLISFFRPSTAADETLMRAMFLAPLYHQPGSPRPAWIVDSRDGAGTGKTTLVEYLAELYNCKPVRSQAKQITNNFEEVVKRLVAADSSSRIFLLDNVTGNFTCPALADMITASTLSGRPAYGRGEVTRPNDLTYIITANSATVDNDLADRSWFVYVRAASMSSDWQKRLHGYISNNRKQIFADMISMIHQAERYELPPSTRFPEFESVILQAVCRNSGEYELAIKRVIDAKSEANLEEGVADIVRDHLLAALDEVGISQFRNVFFTTAAVDSIFWKVDLSLGGSPMQIIRNLCKQRRLPELDANACRHRIGGGNQRRGIMWKNGGEKEGFSSIIYDPRMKKLSLV
jgi:hypothetical protein